MMKCCLGHNCIWEIKKARHNELMFDKHDKLFGELKN